LGPYCFEMVFHNRTIKKRPGKNYLRKMTQKQAINRPRNDPKNDRKITQNIDPKITQKEVKMKTHKSHIPSSRSKARGWTKVPEKVERDETKVQMIKYQVVNCSGCRWSDPRAVGSGKPCCTYAGILKTEPGVCLTKAEEA
jgi:hypothetical protein